MSRFVVGITGASGTVYARRLIQVLDEHGHETHVVASDAALRVLREEEGISVGRSLTPEVVAFGGGRAPTRMTVYAASDIGARLASGSARLGPMIVVPCSMSTLGALATASGRNLVHRAADVTLKEGRRLVVVPRETPVTAAHLENMLALARLGARIVPASPGFYARPASLAELIDHFVMRLCDQLDLEIDLAPRWREPAQPDEGAAIAPIPFGGRR